MVHWERQLGLDLENVSRHVFIKYQKFLAKKINTATVWFSNGSELAALFSHLSANPCKELATAIIRPALKPVKETDSVNVLKNPAKAHLNARAVFNLEDTKLNWFSAENYFPKQYTASNIKPGARKPVKPRSRYTLKMRISKCLTRTCNSLPSGNVGGSTWKRTHANHLMIVAYLYGYFGQIMGTLPNPDKIYIFKSWFPVRWRQIFKCWCPCWPPPRLVINGNPPAFNKRQRRRY